jgi:hypothetical protein
MNSKPICWAILGLFTTIFACHDSPSFNDPVIVYGPHTKLIQGLGFDNKMQFSAKKNGIPFTGNINFIDHTSICDGCFSLSFLTFEDSITLRERIVISNLNLVIKDYHIISNPSQQTMSEDIGMNKPTKSYYNTKIEDERLDSYTLFDMADNWLKIESLDTMNGIIIGYFQLHFEKTWEQDPTTPKYVKFSEGAFEFNYKE